MLVIGSCEIQNALINIVITSSGISEALINIVLTSLGISEALINIVMITSPENNPFDRGAEHPFGYAQDRPQMRSVLSMPFASDACGSLLVSGPEFHCSNYPISQTLIS